MNAWPLPRQQLVLLLFAGLAFVLYFPVLGNGFLSDDYDSLYRIAVEKRVLYREYFRPMIDLTFYLNYLVGGLHPRSYYWFNLIFHIANAYLLYRFGRKVVCFADASLQERFAFLCGLLFLVYPFHNEGIVWLSGRLSSMACFFALLTLNIAAPSGLGWRRFGCSAACFLVGMLCYESIVLLPMILILLAWNRGASRADLLRLSAAWTGVILLYLLMRYVCSGVVYGDYGQRMVQADQGPLPYMAKYIKVLGRLLLPPSEHSRRLTWLFIALAAGALAVHLYILRRLPPAGAGARRYLLILAALGISLWIPMAFGVSTRTSEGDRLLYFPSVFLCMALSALLVYGLRHRLALWGSLLLILTYFVFFLELNNRQWVKASQAAAQILQRIDISQDRELLLINVPDELEGAYVFRHGLQEAVTLRGEDSSRLHVSHYLQRLEYLPLHGLIQAQQTAQGWYIYPSTQIQSGPGDRWLIQTGPQDPGWDLSKTNTTVYYWNCRRLVKLL